MDTCSIEEYWIRNWLDQKMEQWETANYANIAKEINSGRIEFGKCGGYATAKGIDILFGETDPVSEYLQKKTHEELVEQLRKYCYSLNIDCAETKKESVRAFLRRRKRILRWIRLPYLVIKHFMITKNLKLAVKLAGLVLR